MPKRPRQHELEQLSRRSFNSALPTHFVFEDRHSDYGIDGSIEIFRDGSTTGDFFDVQLKGTDRPLEQALKVYIPHGHAQYYRSLGRPLLMVRHHAPTDTLYARWFHSFDPHYGGVNDKTITFTWTSEHIWTTDTPGNLETQVAAFRRFRSAALDLPLHFGINATEDRLHGVSADELTRNIRTELNSALAGLVEITTDADVPQISLASGSSVIDLQSVASATLHHEGEGVNPIEAFPFDIGLGIALALDQVGHADIAARVAIKTAGHSALIEQPDVLFWIVGVLARTQRIREALDLADNLGQRQDSGVAASAEIIRLLPALIAAQPLNEQERAAQIESLKRQAESADAAGDLRNARTAHYNLARQLRQDDPGRALHHFFEAVRCDSGYLNRDYFCKEIAALFFVNGHFEFAVEFYRRALDLGAKGITPVLLADSLLFSGRYLEAYKEFKAALSASDDVPMEFYLKFRATGWLLGSLGIDEQDRDNQAAETLAMEADPTRTSDERKRLCYEALAKDALCGPAWHTLGVEFHREAQVADAFRSFVISCVIEPWHVGPWANAIGTVPGGTSEEEKQLALLAGSVIAAAHSRHGDQLELAIRAGMSGTDEAAKDRFMSDFRALIDSVKEEEQDDLELRLLSEEGDGYDLIRLPRA